MCEVKPRPLTVDEWEAYADNLEEAIKQLEADMHGLKGKIREEIVKKIDSCNDLIAKYEAVDFSDPKFMIEVYAEGLKRGLELALSSIKE